MGYYAKDHSYVIDDDDIRNLEAQRKMSQFGPSGMHPDRVSVDNMDDDQIRSLEAQRKILQYGPSGIHPDRVSIDNMDDDQIRSLEAQVLEGKRIDLPYIEYFKKLIENPIINNEKEFSDSVMRAMQSNRIIQIFYNEFIEKLSSIIFQFRKIDNNDLDSINNFKNRVENLVIVYQKFLYELKRNGWNFKDIGVGLDSLKVPEDLFDNLWQIQKKFNINFDMLIPADLGDYYGHEFERKGKMIPGFRLMYDDLSGKKVEWHQIINYKENELTPYQRFKLSQDEKRKKFEQARQEEISNNLNLLSQKEISMGGRK